MAAATGAVTLAGLFVVRADAPSLWGGLTSGAGLAAVAVSATAGVATAAFVAAGLYARARVSAATAVVALIGGWALAQRPELLPGLTIHEAAAGRSTLLSMLIALVLGALLLVPSLGFLFTLVLRGRFDGDAPERAAPPTGKRRDPEGLLRTAAAGFAAGAALMVLVDMRWALITGVVLLLGSVAAGFVSLASLITDADSV